MMLLLQLFEDQYPVLASFRRSNGEETRKKKTFTKNKGGWKCGNSFIPKKSKCYTDPITGNKLKEPTTYNQYRKKRANSVRRKAKGQQLNDKEKIYAEQVESDRQKLKQKKFIAKTKVAAKKVGYSSNVLAGGIADVDPDKIKVDPKRFQYKIAGTNTKSGSVGSLAGVKKYDPNLAGIIQVWADPKDGNTYVVNGHNRLEFEKKMGVKKRPAKFLDVKSAKEARAVGALTNIAEGRGNARDAAKFFRDSGISREDLEKRGVPLREKIATDGIAMSQLSDGLFNQVIQGELPESRAVVIGGKLKDHTQQEALVKLIAKEEKRGRKVTNDVVSELADMTSTAPKQQEAGNLLTLLGLDPDERSLALEKAEISASVKRSLNKDKKLFGTVGKSKAADNLKRGGNEIDVEMSAKISQSAGTTLTLFEKKKFESGKVDDILNQSAQRLANGEKREKIAREARQEIEEYLKQQFKYGRRSSNFSRKGSGDSTDVARFGQEKATNMNNTYKRRSKKGKVFLVRKRRNRKRLIQSAELIGGAGGLSLGAKAGELLVKAAGRNGMIRKSAMAGGGLAGGAIVMMLADRALKHYE